MPSLSIHNIAAAVAALPFAESVKLNKWKAERMKIQSPKDFSEWLDRIRTDGTWGFSELFPYPNEWWPEHRSDTKTISEVVGVWAPALMDADCPTFGCSAELVVKAVDTAFRSINFPLYQEFQISELVRRVGESLLQRHDWVQIIQKIPKLVQYIPSGFKGDLEFATDLYDRGVDVSDHIFREFLGVTEDEVLEWKRRGDL